MINRAKEKKTVEKWVKYIVNFPEARKGDCVTLECVSLGES